MLSRILFAILILWVPWSAWGQDQGVLGGPVWYGGLHSSHLISIEGDGDFLGRTQSVYGGTPSIPMDKGGQLGLTVGARWATGWWAEMELGRVDSSTNSETWLGSGIRDQDIFQLDGEIESKVFMVNVGYDLERLEKWATPYFRVGLGLAENTIDATLTVEYLSQVWEGTTFEGESPNHEVFPSGKVTEFAWSTAFGVKKRISDRLFARLEYSYQDIGDVWSEADENTDLVMISGLRSPQVGIRMEFDFR
ncbi:MAG: porin family protein [Gammaproteobacteria bacterium]|nr:porin family protein [Gammaproteobacteria bacterium]